LNKFVDWFASGVFDDEWSFKIMKEIFSKIGYPKDDYHLFDYFELKLNDQPDEVLNCIKAMVDNSNDEQLRNKLYLNKEVVKEILKQLYNKSDKSWKNLSQIMFRVAAQLLLMVGMAIWDSQNLVINISRLKQDRLNWMASYRIFTWLPVC